MHKIQDDSKRVKQKEQESEATVRFNVPTIKVYCHGTEVTGCIKTTNTLL